MGRYVGHRFISFNYLKIVRFRTAQKKKVSTRRRPVLYPTYATKKTTKQGILGLVSWILKYCCHVKILSH